MNSRSRLNAVGAAVTRKRADLHKVSPAQTLVFDLISRTGLCGRSYWNRLAGFAGVYQERIRPSLCFY